MCEVNRRAPYARLVITRHDEYWFGVRAEDVDRFVPEFQQIHWDFWQALADVFDLGEIPEAYRWFSEVNVDTVIRKSPKSIDTPTRVCQNRNTGHVRKPYEDV
ncbi:MAG: hypothetical protein VKL39_20505 [Leptolyngbyaceae bacterium]|nr:hypothetical protein [Leptolyngbyaceae bacterium]